MLAQIISLLPQLTPKELRQLQSIIDAELDKLIDIDRSLYDAIFEVTGEYPLPVQRFSSSSNGAIWRKNFPVFDTFRKKLIGSHQLRKNELMALDRLLVQILVEDLKSLGKPLTLKHICEHLSKIGSAFDGAFPEYMKSGHGHIILSQLMNRNP